MPEFDYSKEFGAAYHRARRLSENAEGWIAEVRADKLQRWIGPNDRVLEYGVGYGWNLAALTCAQKVGFDLTPDLRSYVEAKGIRFESSADALSSSTYDKVIAHHVLEHVPSPHQCLTRLKSVVASGGRLLLFVPFERERKYWSFDSIDRAHHLYSWTPASLQRVVTTAGWTVEQTRLVPFRFDRMAAVLANKLRGGLGLYRFLRRTGLVLLPQFEIFLLARKS